MKTKVWGLLLRPGNQLAAAGKDQLFLLSQRKCEDERPDRSRHTERVKREMETTQHVYVSLPSSLFTKFKDRVQNFHILGSETGS